MNILFPANEPIGLQAKRMLDSSKEEFYTLVTTNEKGGITSVKSLSPQEVKEIKIDVVVVSQNTTKYENANVIVDDISDNVDKALVKVLQEKLFKKSA